jgi:hypothetical protein
MGKITDKRRNRTFFVFNTHFDHIGKEAMERKRQIATAKSKRYCRE